MIKTCPKCNNKFDDYSKWGPKKFCSRKCSNSRIRTDEIKEKISKTLSGRKLSEEHIQKLSGDCNHKRKGKNFPPKVKVEKTCNVCNTEFVTTSKTNFCSRKCWMAHNEECRTAFENYKIKCQFNFNVNDYPELFNLSLIEEYGWYSPKNRKDNRNGVSRDHRFSVKQGFISNVDPYFIAHPVNCELTPHTENQRKHTNCSLTIEELKEKVEYFDRYSGRGRVG